MTRPRPAWTPPLRDGVSASRVAVSGGPWPSVAAFLTARLRPGIAWAERIARGEVLDAQGQPVSADSPCQDGAVYWYWRSLPPEPRVPFELDVLHQCEHLVVVDKPHFLPVTPGGRHLQETALVRLKRQLGIATLVPMHRLDLETAGVLAFTVQPAARHAYHALMREHRAHKVYEAVAPWRGDLALPVTARHRLQEPAGAGFMQMQVLAGEPNAHTRIELLRRLDTHTAHPAPAADLALYRLTPLTGRKHQLRAQLNALGLPIVGDRIYPRLWPEPVPDAAPDFSHPLQLLARELAFTDPVTGQPRRFVSRRQLALAVCADTARPSSTLQPDPPSP
jgi:tRNA pseudouridine32 synthase / 23S rRNA pseudouridine746 synthase